MATSPTAAAHASSASERSKRAARHRHQRQPHTSRGRGHSLLQVVAKAGGPTSLAVTVKAGEGETFSVSVGGETKADLTMKKGEPNYVGDAEFSAVDITEVAQQPPSLPTASTR